MDHAESMSDLLTTGEAAQDENEGLRIRFANVAQELSERETTNTDELLAAQGEPVDIGSYFWPDNATVTKVMRPSPTFNAIITGM